MATLLLVDDNEQILQVLDRYARAQGHETVLPAPATRRWRPLPPGSRTWCCWT